MSTSKHKLSSGLCWLIGIFLTLCGAALSQTVTGSISGTVVDQAGQAIVGATVTARNERTGDSRSSVTNESGVFTFTAMQPGAYTVKVEQSGFSTFQRQNNVLAANESLALGNLPLLVGKVEEVITTTAAGEVIETKSSNLTGRLTSDQIALISTKGRDITSLLRLVPGTSNNNDVEAVGEGFGTDLPNVSGQRGRSTVATINGLNASEPSGSNKLSMTINQDAVAEVTVLRNNYGAEYGNNGGALINLVTKSGNQEYHATGYYFLRNEALNASPFFNNKAGLAKPLYRHNIWGFNVGGPVQIPKLFPNNERSKLFFFYSYEKPHTITPQDPRFVTMPTALERAGDFSQSVNSTNAPVFVRDPLILTGNCSATDQSACFRDASRATATNPLGLNIVPIARFNSNGLALLKYFPLPNTNGKTAAGLTYNYVVQSPVDVPKRSQVLRMDYKPNDKDSIYVNSQWWTSDNEGTGTSGWPGNDENRWGISSHYLYKDNGTSVNWVHIFSPTIVNEFNIGFRHDSEGFVPSDGEIARLDRATLKYTAPQLFPDNNKLGTIPRATNFAGVLGTPANINWLDRWGETGNDYIRPSFSDNISFEHGNHSFKFGAYFERMRNGEAPGGQWSGVFNFSGTDTAFTASLGNTGYAYANALIGNFDNYQESSARPFTNLGITILQWYAQDQWRVKSNLTVTYGLRLGYHSQWRQIDNLASNFDPTLYDPAKAPRLYAPFCVGGTPATAACATANRRAIDPANPSVLLTNTNLVGTFVPNSGDFNDGLALAGVGSTPKGFKNVLPVDTEPRLGIAWDLFGKGRTVIRAMGGVYHAPRAGGGTTGGNLVNNSPFQRNLTVNFGNIDNLVNLTSTALSSPTSLNAVERDSHTAATYNFQMGVQQELGFGTVIEVSYVGSLTRHLGERRDINQVPDTAKWINVHPENRNPFSALSANGPNLLGALADNFLRPYRGYGSITEVMYTGTSNYHGLQIQLNRRYTHGFQFGVAYTYSKTFDYANDDSSDVFAGRPYRAFNYSTADFDQTHIFTVNYIWDVPGISRHMNNNGFVKAILDGWQISGTTSFASGKPKVLGTGTGLNFTYANSSVAITAGQSCPSGYVLSSISSTTCTTITDLTGGSINARPNIICDPNGRPGTFDPTGMPYVINTSCFAKPTVSGDIGNMPRNIIRLPSTFNTDLAFFKNVKVGEKHSFQFRWETYNIFNRTNITDIDGAMTFDATGKQTNSRFGAPIGARSPRVMQGSLRFSF